MIEETTSPENVEKENDLCQTELAARARGILKGTYGQTKEEIDAYLGDERNSWES